MLDAHLLPAVHGPSLPLTITALHVHGEPIPIAEVHARAADFAPFGIGDAWGAAWDTTWFRLTGAIPTDWAGREVVARVALGYTGQTGFGAEALLWRGDTPAQGISPDHDEICVARPASGGEPVDLLVEAAANPAIDQEAGTWPLLLPDPGGAPLFTLARAELCVVDRDVEALCRDMRLVLDLSSLLDDTGWRAGALLAALQTACMLVDPEHLADSVAAADAPLRDVLADTGSNRRHRVIAVGHAHIDTAWLWPLRETRRKCARTFSTVLSLMDADPDFRFAASQMQQYAWVRDDHPELYARIRERVAEGRWEPVGGMWVESDANIASAESLVRQVLHGTLFLLDEFGVQPRVGWLPDTFGFPATLPQILADAGMPYFMTQKLSWNQSNAFPHSTFWWEGLDGTRLLTHMPPVATYNGDVSPGEVLRSERDFRDHGVSSSSLYPFGLGDGGGGPTRQMLQRAHRMRDVDGLPRLEQGTAAEFFERVAAEDADRLPSWRGELYLERHRGVFTTHARIKRDNRIAERLLREAETWSALRPDGLRAYPAAALDEAWKLTLLHQFHDILPGTSIHSVYDDAARDHRRAHDLAGAAIDDALQAIAARVDTSAMRSPVVIFNAATHARTDQRCSVTVPGLGYATIDAASTPEPTPVTTTADSIDNGVLRITWDTTTGLLTSIFDMQAQREVLAAQAWGNLLQVFKDHPTDYDAWEIDADDLRTPYDITECSSIEVRRDALRTVRRYGQSTITQTMTVRPGDRRIDFHTSIDWRESHRLLKVAFRVNVRAATASYDLQFGHVERPTHENTSWDAAQFEVPAHRFADVSEPGYGVALLNDGKHGYDIRGNTLRLTLLRATTAPDPTADRGAHEFTYALLPHSGDLVEGRVAEHAEAWELPLREVPTTAHAGDLPPTAALITVESHGAAHVVATAVKKSERGEALVVRLCEVAGGRGSATIRVPQAAAARAARCDVIERPGEPLPIEGGAVILDFRPFQLATLRFDQSSRHTSGDDR
jgi:alpha-mannosidase